MSSITYFEMTCDRCGHSEKFKEGVAVEGWEDLCPTCEKSYRAWWDAATLPDELLAERTKTSAIEACLKVKYACQIDLAVAQTHEDEIGRERAAEGMRVASRIASAIDAIGPDGKEDPEINWDPYPSSSADCAFWGPTLPDGPITHPDCPVVVFTTNETKRVPRPETPVVCACECRTCKRAWEAAGRPILKDGEIIYRKEST